MIASFDLEFSSRNLENYLIPSYMENLLPFQHLYVCVLGQMGINFINMHINFKDCL